MKNRWTKGLVLVFGCLVLAYGVAQPGIMRLFDVKNGEDLKVADIISVLMAVLGLAAASVGVLVYSLVRHNLDELAQSKVDLKEARVRLPILLQMADQAWQRLEPLLLAPLGGDAVRKALCLRVIDDAEKSCVGAADWLARAGPAFENGAFWKNAIDFNLAFFLACRVYVSRPDNLAATADRARQLVSDTVAHRPETQETVAWVELCCNPAHSPAWNVGRARAIQVVAAAHDPLMRLRYQAAFGGDFFPPPPPPI